LDAARTARKKSEAACKQATDASRALEAACAALRGAAQTAHQLVEEERRLRKGAEDQVKRLAARAQAAAKPEEGEASEDARGVDELRSALADAEAMNAALLEDVDATAVALDELRAQNASLIEGSSAHDAAWRASLQQATTQQAECRQATAERDAVQKQLDATRYVIAEMKALVEAKAGVSVPAPCQCKCVLLRAVALALLLSMFLGAPAAMVFSLIGCCCCKCWKCCRGGCCGPKPDEAPEDYAALSDTEKQQPSSLLAASRDEK